MCIHKLVFPTLTPISPSLYLAYVMSSAVILHKHHLIYNTLILCMATIVFLLHVGTLIKIPNKHMLKQKCYAITYHHEHSRQYRTMHERTTLKFPKICNALNCTLTVFWNVSVIFKCICETLSKVITLNVHNLVGLLYMCIFTQLHTYLYSYTHIHTRRHMHGYIILPLF